MILTTGEPESVRNSEAGIEVLITEESIHHLIDQGEHLQAEQKIKQQLETDQSQYRYWILWSELAVAMGKHAAALQLAEQAYQVNPNAVECLNNLGNLFLSAGETLQAIAAFEQSLQIKDNQAEILLSLAGLYFDLGSVEKAANLCLLALQIEPEQTEAKYLLALTHLETNDIASAVRLFQEIVKQTGCHEPSLIQLAAYAIETEDLQQAEGYLQLIRVTNPDHVEGNFLFGILLQKKGQQEESIKFLNELGQKLKSENLHHAAMAVFEKSLEFNPQRADTLLFYGDNHLHCGQTETGIELIEKSLQIKPDFKLAIMNMLFALNYSTRLSAEEIYSRYSELANRLTKDISSSTGWSNETITTRKLKIGYVSADFYNHSVSKFIFPLLSHHDRNNFEIHLYSNSKTEDEVTAQIKFVADSWNDISEIDDELLFKKIQQDQIDILVDLSGHTFGNRLELFMRKPAPIQFSYLGYGYSSGLSCMDYFIADPHFVDTESQHLFSEQVLYLDRSPFCYSGGDPEFNVSPLPALNNKRVTLGNLSRTTRLNSEVYDCWSKILKNNPVADLLLDNPSYTEPETRNLILNEFIQRGVEPERVTIQHSGNYWQCYQQIDFILDTFPHHSGTTTFDALWMGTPVLSKTDRASVGRFGNTILSAINLDEWICDSVEDYINRAHKMIQDLDTLSGLRMTLRDRLINSELMDGSDFASQMEGLYQQVWNQYCSRDQS